MKKGMSIYGKGLIVGTGVAAMLIAAALAAMAGDIFTVDKDGAARFAVSDAGKITVGATESFVNLAVQTNDLTPDTRIDVAADVLTVEGIRLENVNVSADITVSGVGGLDTGGEDSDKWYYIWVIANGAGTSVNALLTKEGSASEFAPVMPFGYTKKRRVGSVKNSGGNFLKFSQEGNKVNYLVLNQVLGGGTATSFTDVDCSSFVPPKSRRVAINLIVQAQASANTTFFAYVRKNGLPSGSQWATQIQHVGDGIYRRSVTSGCVDLDASRILEYLISTAPMGTNVKIDILGYDERI